MDGLEEEKIHLLKKENEISSQIIHDLDPTKLINIDFFRSHGLWDEDISKKYNEVVKKWEKIKELTE